MKFNSPKKLFFILLLFYFISPGPLKADANLVFPILQTENSLLPSEKIIFLFKIFFSPEELYPSILVPFSESHLNCQMLLENPGSFDEKISSCEFLSSQIIWKDNTRRSIPYFNWTPAQKQRINQIFESLQRGDQDLALACPDPRNQLPSGDYLTETQTFDIFAAHVAHVIYLEVNHLVPWSILNFSEIELEQLLNSESYYTRLSYHPYIAGLSEEEEEEEEEARMYSHSILPGHSKGLTCDPRIGFRFLSGRNSSQGTRLIGITMESSLAKLSVWATSNLHHVENNAHLNTRPFDLKGRLTGSQQRVTYSLQVRGSEGVKDIGFIYVNGGCQATSLLLRDLARSINLPLTLVLSTEFEPSRVVELNRQLTGHQWRNLFNFTHMGLVFRAGHENPLILYHSDLIYDSENYFPAFPTLQDGTAIVDSFLYQENILRTFWVSPESLGAAGFRVYSDFPKILNGIGYGTYNAYSEEGPRYGRVLPYENLGRFLGYWQGEGMSLADPPDPRSTISYLRKMYERSLKNRACSWGNFLENFCQIPYSPRAFRELEEANLTRSRTEELSGLEYFNTQEMYDRALSCVQSRSDCIEIERQAIEDWQLLSNANFWRD